MGAYLNFVVVVLLQFYLTIHLLIGWINILCCHKCFNCLNHQDIVSLCVSLSLCVQQTALHLLFSDTKLRHTFLCCSD